MSLRFSGKEMNDSQTFADFNVGGSGNSAIFELVKKDNVNVVFKKI